MSAIDELIENNRRFAVSQARSCLEARPRRAVAVLTCMDARIDVMRVLGLGAGEAHVLRNAGAVVTDDVIRSLAISQRRLGTRAVMVIAHTDCGLQTITDEAFREELAQTTGVAPAFPIEAFGDLDASVRESIRRLRRSPFVLDAVRGFVYDVSTHRLREVTMGEDDGTGTASGGRAARHPG